MAVLAGAAVGGGAGMTFVSLWLVPGVYSFLEMESICFCTVGVFAGYLPGIVVYCALRFIKRRSARLVGILAAAMSAALVAGLIAAFFGAAAHV
jgi:hypothetical protein